MALLASLAVLLGAVRADDASCLLQSQKARQAVVEVTQCQHGDPETYDFSSWQARLYAKHESVDGITIKNFVATPACLQPAIFNSVNGHGSDTDILACECNALVMAEDGSTSDSVDDCHPKKNHHPTITLEFDEPQTILAVKYFDIEEDDTTFKYWVQGGGSKEVTVDKKGNGKEAPVDLSTLSPAPIDITKIKIQFGGSGAFTSMSVCKGSGSLVGDPHVRTVEHSHYTVLNQGNFLAWHYKAPMATEKHQAEFQIFSHYSAQGRSWTRGLLLMDKSMGSHHSLELTAEECKLRKDMDGEWKTLEGSQHLLLPKGKHVTGFNLTQSDDPMKVARNIWTPKGKKVRWDVQFLMKTEPGIRLVATVQLRCFPGRHIDIQVVREHMADARFIQGQLGAHSVHTTEMKNALGHWFKASTDEKFQVKKGWTELGGSSAAASYFGQVDQEGQELFSGSTSCSPQEAERAKQICLQSMSEAQHADADFLEDCILDVCAGQEEAAELAADIFSS